MQGSAYTGQFSDILRSIAAVDAHKASASYEADKAHIFEKIARREGDFHGFNTTIAGDALHACKPSSNPSLEILLKWRIDEGDPDGDDPHWVGESIYHSARAQLYAQDLEGKIYTAIGNVNLKQKLFSEAEQMFNRALETHKADLQMHSSCTLVDHPLIGSIQLRYVPPLFDAAVC